MYNSLKEQPHNDATEKGEFFKIPSRGGVGLKKRINFIIGTSFVIDYLK